MFAATETLAFYKSQCIDDRRSVGQPLSEAVNALLVAGGGGMLFCHIRYVSGLIRIRAAAPPTTTWRRMSNFAASR
ncbi:hypothetical protein COCHEDRAFT_1022672, partial [Bipolaris maydis C5]